jgi:hypothetical protein
MAPSVLLQSQDAPYYTPGKVAGQGVNVDGAVALDARSHGGGPQYPVRSSSSYGNGQTSANNGTSSGSGFAGRQLDGGQFITSELLLEQSKKFAVGRTGPDGTPDKPNVLYIMADQMAAPLLKMNNPNSVIQTPNLDKLANEGVVFSSAYCNSPLCAPSRFTMVTGQLPSKIGGYDNASVFGSDVPTYAHYLRNEGYETVLAGKMHFIGADQLHGFEHR